ncbi:hypothetical protein BD0134_11370 [Helicobacter pylori]
MDYISVDEKENVIPNTANTAVQSKFVGRNGAECFEKFLSKDYEKYFENGVNMEIPKDFFGDFQKKLILRSRFWNLRSPNKRSLAISKKPIF